MKTGQAPLRTFGDLKQFFDIQTGANDSAEKKLSKKKKSNKKVQSCGFRRTRESFCYTGFVG